MRRLEAEPETAIFGAVERGTERQQLADALGSLVDEDLDRFRVGEAVAGGEGVLGVLGWGVTRPDRDGDTALGPGCRAVGKRALGKQQRLTAFGRQAPCGPESGDSGTDDEGNGLGHRLEYRRPRGGTPASAGSLRSTGDGVAAPSTR